MRDFHELHVWQRAHQLTLEIYQVSRSFPDIERFGITSQIRRSSSSIAANIAEGCGRSSDNELARFLTISIGSLAELSYFILLAHDLGYLSTDQYQDLDTEATTLRKMLITFHRKLKPFPS